MARARTNCSAPNPRTRFAHLSAQRLATVAERRPGLIAQQEIDDAHSRDLVTEAQIASAKSALAAAAAAGARATRPTSRKVKTLMDYTRVTAPFAGVITKRFADTGSMIQAGTASQTQAMPLVRLCENSMLRLILPVPESAVPDRAHRPAGGGAGADAEPQTFPGRVARFTEQGRVRHPHHGYRSGRCQSVA